MSLKSFNEFDKAFVRFLKYVLGVHSKASNFGFLSKLGQFPLIISIITSCINFWVHVVQSKINSLISQAYWEQCNTLGGKSMWLNFVKNVLYELGFSHVWENQSTFSGMALVSSLKNKLKEMFISFWTKKINSITEKDKLRNYKLIKLSFGMERYLTFINDGKQRKSLTALRISAHKLKIERGRYSGQSEEERLCAECNVVEDEIKFLSSY